MKNLGEEIELGTGQKILSYSVAEVLHAEAGLADGFRERVGDRFAGIGPKEEGFDNLGDDSMGAIDVNGAVGVALRRWAKDEADGKGEGAATGFGRQGNVEVDGSGGLVGVGTGEAHADIRRKIGAGFGGSGELEGGDSERTGDRDGTPVGGGTEIHAQAAYDAGEQGAEQRKGKGGRRGGGEGREGGFEKGVQRVGQRHGESPYKDRIRRKSGKCRWGKGKGKVRKRIAARAGGGVRSTVMKRRKFMTALAATPATPALLAQQGGRRTVDAGSLERTKISTIAADSAAETVVKFFSPQQFAVLKRLSDLLMPAMNGNPGALDAGAAEFLDFLIGASGPERQQLYKKGLDGLEAASKRAHGKSFAALDTEQADGVLRPWLTAWTYDPPTDPMKHFVADVRADVRTATLNSREWSVAAASGTSRRRRGGGAVGLYWYPVDPTRQF